MILALITYSTWIGMELFYLIHETKGTLVITFVFNLRKSLLDMIRNLRKKKKALRKVGI